MTLWSSSCKVCNMKIKRWAIYDGVAEEYYSKRFVFRRNAETAAKNIVYRYILDCIPVDDVLSAEEIESIRVVELT